MFAPGSGYERDYLRAVQKAAAALERIAAALESAGPDTPEQGVDHGQ